MPLGSVLRAAAGDWPAVLYAAAFVNLLAAALALLALNPMRRGFIRRSMAARAAERAAAAQGASAAMRAQARARAARPRPTPPPAAAAPASAAALAGA